MRKQTKFISVGDNQIAIHKIYEENEVSKSTSALILCHGITYSSLAVYDVPVEGSSFCEKLALSGYEVYMPDYIGYGKSIYNKEDLKVNLSTALRDLYLTIRHLKKKENKNKVGILGWSWGAQVAGQLAQVAPQLVSGLILYGFKWHFNNISLAVPDGDWRKNNKEHLKSDFVVEETRLPKVIENYVQKALMIDPVSPNGPREEVISKASFLTPTQIKAPTLIIHGHAEPGLNLKDNIKFFKKLDGEEKEYIIIYGGHPLHLEKNHKYFFNLVTNFCNQYLLK